MCKNIAIFGPTHSGKSTLMGYLLCKDLDVTEKSNKFDRIKHDLLSDGLAYHSDRKYAYIVDTATDEKRELKSGTQITKKTIGGGSKHIHICKVNINNADCVFFETPGSDQYWKEKNEGVFLGDIGIYVIELPLLLELSQKVKDSNNFKELEQRIFSPLYLWKHYKNVLKLIIVISKIDLDYSRFAIETSINLIHSVDAFKNVEIVPISIDIDNDSDCNIYKKNTKIEGFYNGKTMFGALSNIIDQNTLLKANNDSSVFAHVHRIFYEIKDNKFRPATSLRIKLLSGKISIGDKLNLGPIKEKNSSKILFAEGVVESLQLDPSEMVQSLGKGEVGGVIFNKFIVDGRARNLSEFELKRTSVIFGNNTEFEKGNLLFLTVDLHNEKSIIKETFTNLKIKDRIKIIWFGKVIATELVGRTYSDSEEGRDKWNLILINYTSSTEDSSFLLTLNEKREFIYNNFVLQLPNDLYVKSELTDIDSISMQLPGQVDFTCDYSENLFKDFSAFILLLKVDNLNIEKSEATNSICFTGITNRNISNLMSIIRKFMKQENIVNYQIDIKSENI